MFPMMRAYYQLTITDKHGKIVRRTRKRRCRSWVKQWLQIFEVYTAHDYGSAPVSVSTLDTSNTARANTFDATVYNNLAMFALDNDSTYGLVVGTGTGAESNTDYALGTQIDHGVGSGQLDHGAHSKTTTAVVGSNVDYQISRTFYNGSGGSISVTEIGIYLKSKSAWIFCILRDVISAVAVANTQTLTVTITFRTTV